MKKTNRLIDLTQIKALVEAGATIRSLSISLNIPYATLYRAINKGRKERADTVTSINEVAAGSSMENSI